MYYGIRKVSGREIQRFLHLDKMPVPSQDLHWLKRTSQYQHKKGHDEYFSVPVLDHLVSISAGLVPQPAFFLGAAERSQEKLYYKKV
jgi:hypothetical protein